jgi:predicted nuclease of predicted toxin-antitoxin system
MKIIVDENVPRLTVEALRVMGHTVIDLRGSPEEGCTDEALWARAQQEQALLISTDRGFSHRRGEAHHGVLMVCLRQPNRMKINAKALYAVSEFTEWRGLMVVMQDTVLRILSPGA